MSNFYYLYIKYFLTHLLGEWKPDYIDDYYSEDDEENLDLIDNMLYNEKPKKLSKN